MERIFKIRCSQIGKIMSNAKVKGELSQVCKSHLHEWYANDNEQIFSKYIDKGFQCEQDVIDMATRQLELGFVVKNYERLEDDFFSGECDVVTHDMILDVKASWNNKTLQEQAFKGIDSDYEWQLIGYCHLWNKPKGVLFFGLVNTPEEVNYNIEVSYDEIPENQRWIGYQVLADPVKIELIKQRVIMCREYLEQYDKFIKSKIGRIN